MDSAMQTLREFTRNETLIILCALLVIVAYKMLTSHINLQNLLSGKGKHRHISPSRVQLLALTLAGAFYYTGQIAGVISQGQASAAAGQPVTLAFPPVPHELVILLGASHLVYLGGKSLPILLEHFMASLQGGEK